MKRVVTADGEYIGSKFSPEFEAAEYLIIYDLEERFYGSRKSPSFKRKDKAILIDFLKRTNMENIITVKNVGDSHFNVYNPKNTDATVEEVLMEYMDSLSTD